jgi:hypothetical protein
MPTMDKPRLRATISGQVDAEDQNFIWLYDSARLTQHALRIHRSAVNILELFNGQHSVLDMQLALMKLNGGQLFPSDLLTGLAERLDQAMFLEGGRIQTKYDAFLNSPIREPACIGAYEGEPTALQSQLRGLFTGNGGPGLPATPGMGPAEDSGSKPGAARLRGALIPHIDLYRGGTTFAWGFKELAEQTDAAVFVIIGTGHYTGHRFTLTRKSFRTPLGVAETDVEYVDRIAAVYGQHAFADEVAHLPEHSIEFQVLFLQYCVADRPFRIVPLLVGTFQDCVRQDTAPHEQADIYLMIQALKRAEEESGQRVCYISSGDLAHIGPKFGDDTPVRKELLEHSRKQDHAFLKTAASADRERLFHGVRDERDERRLCGFPPTYTLLSVLEPDHGKLLHYDQYSHPSGFESVSFASMAFYKRG